MTTNDIIASASVRCYCRKVYIVTWKPDRILGCGTVPHGLPDQCECGALGESLEREARASLPLDARLEIAKRNEELRRKAEEALDLFACDGCGRAMRITPSVEALVARHGTPKHCDMLMRREAAQEAAS